LTPPTPQ